MTPSVLEGNDGSDAIQEHPEQFNTEEPESPYGPRNEKLPDQLIKLIECAVKECQQQEMYVRRREVLRDRYNRFYERGYQHVYANQSTGFFMQGTAGGTLNMGGQEIQCPNYIDDYNIFQPYLRIIEAILTQNPPGIDFQPIDPKVSEDMEAAKTAESYRLMFDRSNPIKSIQTQIIRMFGLSSRVVLWTRTEANAQKFGLNDDGTPKQMETCSVYGTLESKVPITAKSKDDSLYVFLYDDPDVKQMKSEYPEFAEHIKPGMSGLGESAYERNARLGVLQGTRSETQMGDAFTHLCTRMHCWFRPAAFTGDKYNDPFDEAGDEDVNDSGEVMTAGEKLRQLFPLGSHCVFVGDQYVGSWAESMDDVLCIGFPYEGDGMFRLALMDPMVVVQDRFNDNMNAAAEVFDMGWPSTWVSANVVDYEAIANQRADPYAIRQKEARGEKLEDDFYREPNPELPETFLKFTALVQGDLPQFMLATPPAIFGAAQEDTRTASGYAQARAQAMGQLGLIWAQIQILFAGMYSQAALAATRNPDHSEEITVPGGDGTGNTIHLARLTKGKFGAFPDQDSSFPESTAQKRTAFAAILQQASLSPAIAAQINQSPRNWKIYANLEGFPELEIPEATSWEKQEFELEQLLKTAPIPPSPEQMQQAQIAHASDAIAVEKLGQPVPPFDPSSLDTSSVPVKKYDYHLWEFTRCKEWLSSADCRREQADGNYDGIRNVELHAAEHEQWMQILAPPPMPDAGLPKPSRPAPPPPQNNVNPAPAAIPPLQ